MLLNELKTPITIVNVSQMGIDLAALQQKLRQARTEYAPDHYLLQQQKIARLQHHLSAAQLAAVPQQTWLAFYQGTISDDALPAIFPSLSHTLFDEIRAMQITRYRLISACELSWQQQGWHLQRSAVKPFVQNQAMVASQQLDYRQSPRHFKALPDFLFDEDLQTLLYYVADQIKSYQHQVQRIQMIIHHTLVYSLPNYVASNSPEGIHQDGIEYIISALVIERENIHGGCSIIYGADKKTPLFKTELQAGQGIFQPDSGTELWHEVTPITLKNPNKQGYRSSIGVDAKIIG